MARNCKKVDSSKRKASEIREQELRYKQKVQEWKDRGYGYNLEQYIKKCEYLISKNIFNAYDLSLKNVDSRYKIHKELDKENNKDLLEIFLSVSLACGFSGNTELLNELIEKYKQQ